MRRPETINANVAGGTLTLDTGNTIVNFGVLEASNGGTLQVQDAVTGDGSAVIAGGTMEFDAAAKIAVTFNNGAGGTNYGLLNSSSIRRTLPVTSLALPERQGIWRTPMESMSSELTSILVNSRIPTTVRPESHAQRWHQYRVF